MSLNRADLLCMVNTHIEVLQLPSRIGYEIAGIVGAIGEDMTEFKVGDRAGFDRLCLGW